MRVWARVPPCYKIFNYVLSWMRCALRCVWFPACAIINLQTITDIWEFAKRFIFLFYFFSSEFSETCAYANTSLVYCFESSKRNTKFSQKFASNWLNIISCHNSHMYFLMEYGITSENSYFHRAALTLSI